MYLHVTKNDPEPIQKFYRLYTYYSSFAEDTEENFLNSLDCLEIIGHLKGDKEILKEVIKARFNYAEMKEYDVS